MNIGAALVFPVAEELRARGVPIVFSTGRGKSQFPAEWADALLVPKPLERRALAEALAALGVAPPAADAANKAV